MSKIQLKQQLKIAFEAFSKRDDVSIDELADKWTEAIDKYIKSMLMAWIAKGVPIPQDGGAGLKATLTATVNTL